jgi:hypothetical protein
MVSSSILLLVTLAFAAITSSMNSIGNVRARNIAHAIADETVSYYERNPQKIPTFVVGEVPPVAPNNLVMPNTINRQISASSGASQQFARTTTFYPVSSDGSNLVSGGNVTADSNLVRVVAEISWTSNNRTLKVTQEGFMRR